ncbi:MAG: hypothetical protein ACTSRP_20810 [Candidatus Helarchaeota archaeon]
MEEKKSNSNLKKITVYISPELKEEMEAFKKEKGYRSLSDMLRRGFLILKHVFGSENIELVEDNLNKKLEKIEERLEDIAMQLNILDKKEALIDQQIEQTPIQEIPSFEVLSSEILQLVRDFDGIKDFVLMDHLRTKYSEGVIWTTLVKLKQQGKIIEKEGFWKINESQ